MAEPKGSLKHMRWYATERADHLTDAIFSASPSLASEARGSLDWLSPLPGDQPQECWNERFLERVGLVDQLAAFRDFWPFSGSGTPHWDALARVPVLDGQGVVMVEAKAHKGELMKPGDKSGARAMDSIAKIGRSCAAARTFYGVSPTTVPWEARYYQVGNRLAHLYWMNEIAETPTWLVWLFFTNDPSWDDRLAAHEWHKLFETVRQEVGLPAHHQLDSRIAAAYLPPSP